MQIFQILQLLSFTEITLTYLFCTAVVWSSIPSFAFWRPSTLPTRVCKTNVKYTNITLIKKIWNIYIKKDLKHKHTFITLLSSWFYFSVLYSRDHSHQILWHWFWSQKKMSSCPSAAPPCMLSTVKFYILSLEQSE